MTEKRNTVIVGEIGLNHSGSVGVAKQLIKLCSELDIPYVKFQKRDINSCYSQEFLDSARESPWGTTQRAQKEGIELSLDDYKEIDDYCKKLGNISWFASPWDMISIDFLENNFPNMPFLKIPSAKVTDIVFLNRCKDSVFDLILSSGMCDLKMIQDSMSLFAGTDRVKYLLACTSSYPCPSEDINLSQIRLLNHYFSTPTCRIGYSDHSGGILFPAMAVSFGAKLVEIHITMDRKLYGSDQASSLEPSGLRHLVKYIEELEKGIGYPKKVIMPSELPIIKKLRN